jgi:hypothetical protein
MELPKRHATSLAGSRLLVRPGPARSASDCPTRTPTRSRSLTRRPRWALTFATGTVTVGVAVMVAAALPYRALADFG